MAKFKPIKTTQEKLSQVAYVAGQLIFTMDTKRLYIDISESSNGRLLVSENNIVDVALDSDGKTLRFTRENGSIISHSITIPTITIDSEFNTGSQNPVQNKVITEEINKINALINDIKNGSTPVEKADYAESAGSADHATTADSATNANHASTADSAESATKASKDGNGSVIVETYETKVDASSKLAEAKEYANKIKNDLLNGAGEAYDTLKELGDLIDENQDAIEALKIVAATKSDWNQNDEAASDYIKNRTHYKLAEKELFLNEVTFDGTLYQINDLEGVSDDGSNTNKLIVTLDGVTYEVEKFTYSSEPMKGWGNSRLIQWAEPDINPINVPFLITTYKDYGMFGTGPENVIWEINLPENMAGASHTLKIEVLGSVTYFPLEEGYIPNSIARMDYVDSNFALKSELEEIDLSKYETKEDITTKINEIKAYINQQDDAIKGSVSTLEEESSKYALKTTVEGIDGRVGATEGKITILEGLAAANKAAHEANTIAISARALQTDLDGVSGRVTTLEDWHKNFLEATKEEIQSL